MKTPSPTFDAKQFRDLADHPRTAKLWDFLNQEITIARMETATYLSRPALEPLVPSLLEIGGDTIREDRWKQMTGRMVRQVMTNRGYMVERTGVKLRDQSVFTTAARYAQHTVTK